MAIAIAMILPRLANAQAQNGWELIGRNDDRAARRAFLDVLQRDSTNTDALRGMIYLSEVEGDQFHYGTYINTLLRHNPDEPTLLLFQSMFRGPYENIINSGNLSEAGKIYVRMQKASELRADRKFDRQNAIYQELFPAYRWSVIGPFNNLAGSGHIIPFPVEGEKYDPRKTYIDETGINLTWLTPQHCGDYGHLVFTRHLNGGDNDTYYANSFIELPEKKSIQIRLARSSPMKIWLDDCLVFDSPDAVSLDYDGEIIKVDVPAGMHRLFLKYSDMPSSETDGESEDIFSFYDHPDYSSSDFYLRITDSTGVPIQNFKSAYAADYTPRQYASTVERNRAIDYFKQRVAADPKSWFDYYALCKAYLERGKMTDAEEFFDAAKRKFPDNVLIKYLAAKSLAANGKLETAYEALHGIDLEKNPVFAILYQKLDEIDPKNDEEHYLSALGTLRNIAPSNDQMIGLYIHFYKRRDRDKDRDTFIDETIATFPAYAEWLEPQKSNHDADENSVSDEERKVRNDSLLDALKTHFDANDYDRVISYYGEQKNHDALQKIYDELLGIFPFSTRRRMEKSLDLFQAKKYDDALRTLDTVFTISPMDEEGLEMAGDIYNEMKDKQRALEYYRRARNASRSRYGRSYSVDTKIEKIEGPRSYKALFSTKQFSDILDSTNWNDKFPNDESVILMYTKDIMLDTNQQITEYHRMMVKILTAAGADFWTQYDFSFMGSVDFVKVIKANGAEIIPDRRGEFVVFKNLVPGDLIQLEGQSRDRPSYYLNNGYYDMSNFSFEVPVNYAKLQVLLPRGNYLGYRMHRLDDHLAKSTTGLYDSYTWEYSGIPKIEHEEALIDRSDTYRNIFLSTVPDWSRIVKWYNRMTYRKLEPTYDIRQRVADIISNDMSDSAKVIAIYNYVTREINYSSVPFLQGAYIPKRADLTLSAKIGDCKDVATLMITMLRAAGIDANYVLVRTNSYSHQRFLPSLYFNHAIVGMKLNGTMRYLDLTTNFCPYYVLPEDDAGAWGLLIKDGEKDLVRLPDDYIDPAKNTVKVDADARLNLDRSLDLNVTAIHPGNAGEDIRSRVYSWTSTEFRNYLLASMGGNSISDLSLVEWKLENQKDITEPLHSTYVFNSSRYSDKVSNLLIFRIPYMISIPSSKTILGKVRHNDLDLRDIAQIEPVRQRIDLHFPKGYALTEFPKDISVKSKFGLYTVSFRKLPDGIAIEKYQQFFMSIIPVDEFPAFKDFYLKILDIDATKYAVMGKRP
ncbi:MAG: Transglutaminase-like superfamily protein [Chlorobi bacterium]|nr:Transglutaminase-like superfamily protein [Chlorobiota bacterium]